MQSPRNWICLNEEAHHQPHHDRHIRGLASASSTPTKSHETQSPRNWICLIHTTSHSTGRELLNDRSQKSAIERKVGPQFSSLFAHNFENCNETHRHSKLLSFVNPPSRPIAGNQALHAHLHFPKTCTHTEPWHRGDRDRPAL